MYSSRAVVRASRVARANAPVVRRNVRFASDSAKTGGSSGALAGGLAGAGAAVGIGYLGYWYSGTKAAVDTATQMKSYMDSAKNQFTVQLKDKTPEVPEAIKALHDMANKYASFVPGGRQYVDKIFKDIDIVREKHGDEVDNIVRELYGELRDVSKSGDLSLTTAGEVWSIFSSHSQKLASLAGDAAQDIMNNHPALKSQLGGSFEQLQQLSDQVGPEAKQKLEDTYKQVSDILAGGIQWNTIEKVHTLVQEKTQDLKKMAEVAFNKGFEQVKPMLEKNPQAKKLIEDNLDTLKNGSVKDLVNQVRSAIESGSTGDLEKYINRLDRLSVHRPYAANTHVVPRRRSSHRRLHLSARGLE